jgi:acyl dehydratase
MTTKTALQGIDGVKKLAGQSLGSSEWRPMKLEDIVRFADATGDHQWIHVDKERAERESPFKAPIAHGYFTLSLIGGLFFELVETNSFKTILNYGLNKVRFPAPLKAGANYRLSLKMGESKDIPGGLETVFQATIEVENEPKPACVAEMVFRFLA